MKVSALQVRQSLGRILEKLKKTDEPIIIEKGREPVPVLISLRVFEERFIDYREEQKGSSSWKLSVAAQSSHPSTRSLSCGSCAMVRIIDASVAIKWFLFEPGRERALEVLAEILTSPSHFAVAELFYFEPAQVFHR
jgi:uncharacterized protein (DUF2249 family)